MTANAVVATVLGSIPASSDTVADEAVLNVVHKKSFKKFPFKLSKPWFLKYLHIILNQLTKDQFINMYIVQSVLRFRIRITFGQLDPDPHSMRIRAPIDLKCWI
jgi:hypothetical protein